MEQKIFVGGDPTKNDNFTLRKVALLWRKKFEFLDGGDLMKNRDFLEGKLVALRCFLSKFEILDAKNLRSGLHWQLLALAKIVLSPKMRIKLCCFSHSSS